MRKLNTSTRGGMPRGAIKGGRMVPMILRTRGGMPRGAIKGGRMVPMILRTRGGMPRGGNQWTR